jgi:hypothetical protein
MYEEDSGAGIYLSRGARVGDEIAFARGYILTRSPKSSIASFLAWGNPKIVFEDVAVYVLDLPSCSLRRIAALPIEHLDARGELVTWAGDQISVCCGHATKPEKVLVGMDGNPPRVSPGNFENELNDAGRKAQEVDQMEMENLVQGFTNSDWGVPTVKLKPPLPKQYDEEAFAAWRRRLTIRCGEPRARAVS